MKISEVLFFASLLCCRFLLSAGHALAWPPDNMPHLGATSACTAHLPTGTRSGQAIHFGCVWVLHKQLHGVGRL